MSEIKSTNSEKLLNIKVGDSYMESSMFLENDIDEIEVHLTVVTKPKKYYREVPIMGHFPTKNWINPSRIMLTHRDIVPITNSTEIKINVSDV